MVSYANPFHRNALNGKTVHFLMLLAVQQEQEKVHPSCGSDVDTLKA